MDDEILALEAELQRAQLSSDVETLGRILDDVLVFTSLDGTIATKDDDLALHRSGRLRIMRMEPIERQMLHLDGTTVVSVKMDAAATLDGVAMTGILRYTRVWHKRSDGWRLVRCPGHNVIGSDASHKYETVSGVASVECGTEIRVEPVGAIAHVGGGGRVSRSSDPGAGRWLEL